MKNVIMVTGATGFLGKHLSRKLSEKTASEIFITTSQENSDSSLHHLNILDYAALKKTVNRVRPSIIYHFAAYVNLSRDYEVAKQCFEVNYKGTLNLLEALRDNPPEKLIFSSTEEIYGNSPVPFYENQMLHPPSPYSITKASGEYLCEMYANQLAFQLVNLRIATMYGPELPESRFFTKIIQKAMRNEDIPINSGRKKRDYVYVNDVINACITILNCSFKNRAETINIGGGSSHSLLEVVQDIVSLSGSTSKIIKNAIPERILESEKWLMSIEKAQKLLKWKPTTTLQEGLKGTIGYYKNLKYN